MSASRSRSSSRSKSPAGACLYVSNLSSRAQDQDLKEVFEKFGVIEYATVVMEPRSQGSSSNISRGFGFVKFQNKDDVQAALKAELALFGKTLKVEISKRDEPRRKTPGRYVGLRRSRSRSRDRRHKSHKHSRRRRSSSSRSRSRSRDNRRRK